MRFEVRSKLAFFSWYFEKKYVSSKIFEKYAKNFWQLRFLIDYFPDSILILSSSLGSKKRSFTDKVDKNHIKKIIIICYLKKDGLLYWIFFNREKKFLFGMDLNP